MSLGRLIFILLAYVVMGVSAVVVWLTLRRWQREISRREAGEPPVSPFELPIRRTMFLDQRTRNEDEH